MKKKHTKNLTHNYKDAYAKIGEWVTPKIPIFLFLSTFIVYVHNLSPSAYGGDSGDFLSAIMTNGVPHPSGYPLYMILGILMNKVIQFSANPALKVGLVSVIFSSLSIVVMYLLINEITKEKFISFATSLTLAFTFPFWLYAEVVEVMSLQYFFIAIIIYLTIKYINTQRKLYIYALSLFMGLSLTNNLAIVIVFPCVGLSILVSNKSLLKNFKLAIISALLFILGLIPLAYLPIAANKYPLINTGMAINFKNFIFLITRHYYGWTAQQPSQMTIIQLFEANLRAYLSYWYIYLNITILFFSLLGLIFLLRNRQYSLFILLFFTMFLFGPIFLLYSSQYSINFGNFAVLEKFFTQSLIITLILYSIGITSIKKMAQNKLSNKILINIAEVSLVLLILFNPIYFFVKNFTKTNLSQIYIGNDFGKDAIENLENNSVVVLQDDTLAYNVFYAKEGLGVRSDITTPSLGYGFDITLKANGLNPEQIQKYKADHQNSLADGKIFHSSLSSLIQNNVVYSDWTENIVSHKQGRLLFVPYGLVYQLIYDKDFNLTEEEYLDKLENIIKQYHTEDLIKYDSLISDHLFFTHIRRIYSTRYLEVARFISERYQDQPTSDYYTKKALEIDPYLELELQLKKTP